MTVPAKLVVTDTEALEMDMNEPSHVELAEAEALLRLRDLQKDRDMERAHVNADTAICKLLVALGYEHVVNEYDKIDKWYA
jgi:hypothetical protein